MVGDPELASMRRTGETGYMGARIRIPLRVLLPCLAVSLVASGAVAVGFAAVAGISGYLMRQADDNLLACASSMLSHGLVAAPGSGSVSGQVPPAGCEMELLSASGQVLIPAAPGTAPGPAIPAGGSWLAAHLARPVTVPGAGTSGRWRVVIEAVHYQPQHILYVYGPDDVKYLISGRPGHGSGGMLVVMAGLAATGRITQRLAAGYAGAAGTVLVLLAAAALALTRAILRPLRQAAELAESAGQAAGAGLPRVMPPRGVRAGGDRSHWPFGMTFMTLSEQLRASRTAEAAAHRDRMLRRVADEVARMEPLIEGLSARSPSGSTGPDLRPARDAAGSDHPASRYAE